MDSASRKGQPIFNGFLMYFPRTAAAVAEHSRKANAKHNPGQPLHWSREKSSDHADCIMRHLVDRGTVDPEDGILHDVKAAWRALAMAQLALEARQPITKFEKYADPKEDPWVKGYRDWERTTLRFPAGPKSPAPYV